MCKFVIGQQVVDQFESPTELVQQPVELIAKQLVQQLPWGHNILIFKKLKAVPETRFYIEQVIENNWTEMY